METKADFIAAFDNKPVTGDLAIQLCDLLVDGEIILESFNDQTPPNNFTTYHLEMEDGAVGFHFDGNVMKVRELDPEGDETSDPI